MYPNSSPKPISASHSPKGLTGPGPAGTTTVNSFPVRSTCIPTLRATAAIAADTDEEAKRLATSAFLHFARRVKGEFVPLASPEEAAAYPYSLVDRERMTRHRERLIVGSAATVKKKLNALVEATQADELMITTMTYDHAARRRSYEILAEAFTSAAISAA